MRSKHNIVYSSDLHGNQIQYQKLFDYAVIISADSVIIGGDITPKGNSVMQSLKQLEQQGLSNKVFIDMQRLFLEERLPTMVKALQKGKKKIPLFIMFGNDDCNANYDVFEKGEEEGLYEIIHGKRRKLTADFEIVGYTYVPITPYRIMKEWEKFDLSEIPPSLRKAYQKRKEEYQFEGYKSSKHGLLPFHFTVDMEKKDSIQKDLSDTLFQENPEKTVYVMHSPPINTNLDITGKGLHVGSFAHRLFIEKLQPYVTLHGHIHETVAMSGSFRQVIGNTLSLASGNHNVGKNLAVVVFDLYDLGNARRIIL
ncbi:MAG: metallophosphoesterase [Nanoarchaeota archaeon]|nr:metallophosphoesterase [Nanoarchaeota archaeon]